MRLKMNQAAGRADCPCEGFIDRGLLCDHLLIFGHNMSVIYEFSWRNSTKVSSHILDFICYFGSK
jgi:hypothetical protein